MFHLEGPWCLLYQIPYFINEEMDTKVILPSVTKLLKELTRLGFHILLLIKFTLQKIV